MKCNLCQSCKHAVVYVWRQQYGHFVSNRNYYICNRDNQVQQHKQKYENSVSTNIYEIASHDPVHVCDDYIKSDDEVIDYHTL